MKIIMLKDVKNVGKKDQVIDVSDGYFTNFLFPRKLAVKYTEKSSQVLAEQKEEERIAEAKAKAEAEELAVKLETVTVEFRVKVGKDGKMFGNISSKQVAEELSRVHGIDIDKRKFVDKNPMNSLGIYRLKIELHKGVIGTVKVHIAEESK